jgi:hypothetical protein
MTIAVGDSLDLAPPRAKDRAAARLRALAATRGGRLLLVAAFTVLMAGLRVGNWWALAIVLALTSAFPQHRRAILVPATLLFVFLMPPVDFKVLGELAPARGAGATAVQLGWVAIPIVWGMAFAFLWVVQRFPKSIVAKRPVTALLAILLLLIFASRTLPLTGAAWVMCAAIQMCFASYIWFFAYWVTENHNRDKAKPLLRTGFWRPFWGFTRVPYGKGAAYLERVEAKNDDELAVAQIKGLKLLIWAVVLTAFMVGVNKLIYRVPAGVSLTELPDASAAAVIPTYQMSLDALRTAEPYPLPMRWAVLVLYFLMRMAFLTVWGAKIIAVARMAGFNAFRNTYRPLESPTIAEYYNRIYYYFKELLVAFFFYPTYLRYFKKWPRVRLFVATLAAAGLGNWLFHFLRDQDLILRHGFWHTVWMYGSYAVYALVLGVAIGVSQLRSNARTRARCAAPAGWARVRSTAVIMLFFLLICTFNEPNDRHGLSDYANYCLRLFVP